ncbi:MAG TPA: radical SAM protein [Thermoanaerobaculia bacterium]|nr:radical SAM protein [Thermoanaerobaculia bacterium]
MDPERRYFAELLEWVRHEERILAVHQARPGWAAVNSSAAWIVQFCEAPDGRTLGEIREGFAQRFGPVSDEEVSAWLDALEGGGLLSQGSERSAATALEPPPYESYRVEHVYVELLARCNLKCIHCYMEGAPERDEILTPEEVCRLLADFRAEQGQYVTLAGGEPLIYPAFAEVAWEAAGLGFFGTVITNGTLLKEKHLDLIDDLGFNLAISLDGITPEVNQEIRGRSSTPIIAALERALEALGPDRVILSYTPVKANLADLPLLFRFVREKGVRRLNLSLYEQSGRAHAHGDRLNLSPAERVQVMETIYRNALELAGEVEIDFNDTREILSQFQCDRKPSELHPLWKGVRVDSRGDVFPSSFGAAQEFRLGNVREGPLAEILRADVLRQLHQTLSDRFRKIPRCSGCVWRQICRGGSVTSSYCATGHLFSPDAYCEGYLKMFPEVAVRLADLAVPS